MPPKKRKTTELESTSTANKRVTRSSTKVSAPAIQVPTVSRKPDSTSSKAAPTNTKAKQNSKTPKSTKAAANKSSTTNKQPDANHTEDSGEDGAHTTIKSLSITSPLVKSSIQCTYYYRYSPNPTRPSYLIFTHGAGGTLSAPAVVNFCTGYSASQTVLAFQGSMNLASRVRGFHAAVEYQWSKAMDADRGTRELVLGGRSMGARAAVVAVGEALSGEGRGDWRDVKVVLVSYPMVGPKGDLRDEVLLGLPARVSVLFVVGDRDAMCPLDVLDGVRGEMEATSQVVVVRGADHGMHTKPAGVEKETGEETGRIAAEWLEGRVQGDVVYIGDEE
ncbi:hypothetical protein CC86DRAFT_61998 [Ophiobolus disseminans]|uniref:KANL3/Tex30 alpha/beta hydrolase-like domain-containing protein n=1 Tax=Ophiobolus disseminans TaxID=1469910 RepID=A0A6A6ZS81_9PLEO|nr:hypothetical protein CC86DRAFT_61998 [Ophiobolus disseminans]